MEIDFWWITSSGYRNAVNTADTTISPYPLFPSASQENSELIEGNGLLKRLNFPDCLAVRVAVDSPWGWNEVASGFQDSYWDYHPPLTHQRPAWVIVSKLDAGHKHRGSPRCCWRHWAAPSGLLSQVSINPGFCHRTCLTAAGSWEQS